MTGLGPLDVMRQQIDVVSGIDEQVRLLRDVDATSPLFERAIEAVLEAETSHPMTDQETVAYGELVSPHFDFVAGTSYSLAISTGGEESRVQGINRGFMVLPVYNVELEAVENRVTHMLEVGQQHSSDQSGNMSITRFMKYVLAAGSEVIPVLPRNAHSLYELHDDPVVAEFDRIVLGSERPRTAILKELGGRANKMLAKHAESDDKNHQRISYLNSLGLLDGVSIATDDYALAHDCDAFSEMKDVLFSPPSADLIVEDPELFLYAPGYRRFPNGKLLANLVPELYAARFMQVEGQQIDIAFMPVKSIADYDAPESLAA